MSDKNFTEEMRTYYEALPSYVQEKITQSSCSFHSLQELRDYVSKLQSSGKSDSHC